MSGLSKILVEKDGKSKEYDVHEDIKISENGKYKITVQDNSGNVTSTAKMILPNTGEKSILIFIAIFVTLSTIMYIKFKKYKDVK